MDSTNSRVHAGLRPLVWVVLLAGTTLWLTACVEPPAPSGEETPAAVEPPKPADPRAEANAKALQSYNEGMRLYSARKYPEALQRFTAALQSDPYLYHAEIGAVMAACRAASAK